MLKFIVIRPTESKMSLLTQQTEIIKVQLYMFCNSFIQQLGYCTNILQHTHK